MHISEYGIDNITEADGLAVGSPSGLASKIADKLIDGIYTIEDNELLKDLSRIKDTEQIKIEPLREYAEELITARLAEVNTEE